MDAQSVFVAKILTHNIDSPDLFAIMSINTSHGILKYYEHLNKFRLTHLKIQFYALYDWPHFII